MQRYFERQEAVVLARLKGKQGRHDTRYARGIPGERTGTKQIDVARIFDRGRWDAELRAAMEPIITRLISDQGTQTRQALGATGTFNLRNPRVQQAISRRVNKIVGINDTTQAAVQSEIMDGEAAGEDIGSIAKRVQGVFADASSYRATTIARTEVIGASNEGASLAADDAGVAGTKSWLAAADDRVRPTHAEADGQEVGVDESFVVGGEQLAYPGDPDGSPEETINCRCTVDYAAAVLTSDNLDTSAIDDGE